MDLPPYDLYLALGVTKDDDKATIRTKYRRLVLENHPDRVLDEEKKAEASDKFHKIKAAYETLIDEDRRKRYDAQVRLAELRKERLASTNTQTRAGASLKNVTYERGPRRSESSEVDEASQEYRSRSAWPIPARMPFSTTVFYDLQLAGELDGRPVSTFPDKGAGLNFLSRAYARKENIQINASDIVTVHTANGKSIRSLGSAKLRFRFKDGVEDHLLDFHVLPRCISDIILGNAFLGLAKAFTQFAHCISRTLRQALPHRICFLGGRQHRMGGWLNGRFVAALPDTGSDLMLMSRAYAEGRGFVIDNDPTFCITLQMGDLSTTHTSGYVGNGEWRFGDRAGTKFGRTELCGFWILDDLACDVIFSDEFLLRTDALEKMAHCEFELETDQLSLSAIKVIQFRSKKPATPPTALEEWNRKAQKERLHQNEVESEIRHLSAAQQQAASDELKRRWEILEAQHPTPAARSRASNLSATPFRSPSTA